MDECFRCGASGEKVRLYDAISSKKIVKICSECNALEKLPIIRKPTENQIINSQRQKSVRDMLAGMSKGRVAGREMTLRELVDKHLKERLARQPSDLVDNFHWIIQRTRRARKITREQFAKAIGESEATVRILESGILPNNDYRIIKKVENYLGINLYKPESSEFSKIKKSEEQPKELRFDKESVSQLRISDLREMKKKQEEEIPKKPIDSWEEERDETGNEILDDEDFFDEEE
jgi:ribosome-binding protein aMBF1 (putative translation factor)